MALNTSVANDTSFQNKTLNDQTLITQMNEEDSKFIFH